ncbi:MAG TPA: DUF3333 domain-containing protein, partial [Novosphingobium sp.]|nr:DUF3333 domain-containing protein [Novosphingobium sp.]
MTDTGSAAEASTRAHKAERLAARLRRRHRSDQLFRFAGMAAVAFAALVLAFLLFTMTANGIGGFKRSELMVPVNLANGVVQVDPSQLNSADPIAVLENAGLPALVDSELERAYGTDGARLVVDGAWRELAARITRDPSLLNQEVKAWLPASNDLAGALRGEGTPAELSHARTLAARGVLVQRLDPGFLTRGDATSPQEVGIWGALKGSILTMLVTLSLAFPIGVLSAVYLEEYAPRNRWTDLIEVSINNLAAVPSIIFGLLGLAVFLGLFPNWRSAPLIGGMTLALMTMPVIVISGRNAIKSVPPSIRDAALGIGASRVQVVFHHVLPLALPGILTGTI